MNWLKQNYEWIFGGIGVAAISAVLAIIRKAISKPSVPGASFSQANSQNQSVNITIPPAGLPHVEPSNNESVQAASDNRKRLTNILFIDDDTKFQVVNILKNSGWVNTKTIKDVTSLYKDEVKDAHIFFVDIKGVGMKLQCKDEGLGLALILKKEYPDKKLVIYSAEPQGNRFHEALRVADDILAKDAEPYEFLHLVDQYSNEIFKS